MKMDNGGLAKVWSNRVRIALIHNHSYRKHYAKSNKLMVDELMMNVPHIYVLDWKFLFLVKKKITIDKKNAYRLLVAPKRGEYDWRSTVADLISEHYNLPLANTLKDNEFYKDKYSGNLDSILYWELLNMLKASTTRLALTDGELYLTPEQCNFVNRYLTHNPDEHIGDVEILDDYE